MANTQHTERARPKPIKFIACAATRMGEMSNGCFELIERMVSWYGSSPAQDPATTGVSKATAVSTFRETCKDSAVIAIVKGAGRTLTAACSAASWIV